MKMRPVRIRFLSRKSLSYFASFLLAGMIAAIAFVKSDLVIASLRNVHKAAGSGTESWDGVGSPRFTFWEFRHPAAWCLLWHLTHWCLCRIAGGGVFVYQKASDSLWLTRNTVVFLSFFN
jgi:hypothetical protein